MEDTPQETATNLADDLLWGAKAIAQFIGQPERATRHKIDAGHLKGVTKLGGTIVASKSVLRRQLVPGA